MTEKLEFDETALTRLHQLGGDVLVRQMIALFLEMTPQRLAAARQGEQSHDRMAIRQAMHSLKSSAGNVGAKAIQYLADRLERLAPDLAPETLAGLLEELDIAVARARKYLENYKSI